MNSSSLRGSRPKPPPLNLASASRMPAAILLCSFSQTFCVDTYDIWSHPVLSGHNLFTTWSHFTLYQPAWRGGAGAPSRGRRRTRSRRPFDESAHGNLEARKKG